MRRIIIEIICMTVFFIGLPWLVLPGAGEAPGMLTLCLAYLAVAAPQIGVTVYIVTRKGRPLADFGLGRPGLRTLPRLGLALLGAVLLLALVSVTVYLILGPGAKDVLFQRPLSQALSPAEIPLLVIFCLAVGYREEVFFRSYLITRLGDLGVKPVWAVLGSTVIFGAAHFYEGVFGVVFALLAGGWFGLFFLKTRDLHAVAGAHALFNLAVWLTGYFVVRL
jgi:membrane protease YdiL (CAAX protease family)